MFWLFDGFDCFWTIMVKHFQNFFQIFMKVFLAILTIFAIDCFSIDLSFWQISKTFSNLLWIFIFHRSFLVPFSLFLKYPLNPSIISFFVFQLLQNILQIAVSQLGSLSPLHSLTELLSRWYFTRRGMARGLRFCFEFYWGSLVRCCGKYLVLFTFHVEAPWLNIVLKCSLITLAQTSLLDV